MHHRKEERALPALPEMIRLIASDIDGTLVPDGAPALNPEYFEVIPALQKKGIIFCPCSGRSYQSMHTLFAPIADSLYFISENGTILRTEEKVLYTWPVPAEYVRPLVEEGRKLPGISVMICTPDKTYCECGEDGELRRSKKAVIPAAIKGPTGMPRINKMPKMEPITSPTMSCGSTFKRSNPFPFIYVAKAPPMSAKIPGSVIKTDRTSLLWIRPEAKGTKTEMVKNNNPNSSPLRSKAGKYRSK